MVSAEERPAARWPAVGYERVAWQPRISPDLLPRASAARYRGPYRAAVVPSIAAQPLVLPGELAAELDDAAAEIARFDTGLGGEITAFAAVLLRSESAASSQIEQLTASARAIAEAEIGTGGRRNADQIVANTRAMITAIELAGNLDAAAILAMHRALMRTEEPAIAGRWRAEQVWIGGGGIGPHDADFVPPAYPRVAPAIDDLVAFMRRADLPVLAQVALAHAQFETIHPFPDGNGRVGRALAQALLRHRGLCRTVTVPISAGLLADTGGYFAALDAYRTGQPAPIISRFATAALTAIANGRQLVADLREVRTGWAGRLTARRTSTLWRVADLLLRHPVVDAAVLSTELGIRGSNVYRYLEPLVAAGILIEFTDRRRHRAWRAPEVLAAVDAFAARAGRRLPAR